MRWSAKLSRGWGALERRGSGRALCEGEEHLAGGTELTLGEWVELRRKRGSLGEGGGQGARAELQRGKRVQMLEGILGLRKIC